MNRSGGDADVTRAAMLAHLGTSGGASRADLARALGLSPALVSQTVKQLMAEGLVRELETSTSSGGRPGRLLGVASTALRSVGLKVSHDHVALVETELDGSVVRAVTLRFDAASVTFLSDLVGLVRAFIGDGRDEPILGIGVGVPGAVDATGTGVVDSGMLGWRQAPLGALMARELDVPVLVENNVNALAVAERLYGAGREHENFLVITIGEGVGAGVVVGGEVVRGSRGGAGEIGHITALSDGPLCTCGKRGCIEALAGEKALLGKARGAGVVPAGGEMAQLQRAADSGNPNARAIYALAASKLGEVVASLVQFIDPEVVIISGEGTKAWTHWSIPFEQALRAGITVDRRAIPVIVEDWEDEAWARGAAALVASTPFDVAGTFGEQGRRVRARLMTGSSATEAAS
ncbi:ROK family transcriptional regulator [Sinomonas gamaensis]|uniref:ROK family transcriptional regulator n=1 Tax=Sinomonas gamaensis TaxID=2565624 RepID=UPI001107DF2E|nr:ROK family transcriptional regulator [Sinomonas gamaensis]